jgi:hypothetical protein
MASNSLGEAWRVGLAPVEENMGLMDKLRNAEQQGRSAARNAFGRALDFGEDAQRRIRQRMRIYPRRETPIPSEVSEGQPAGLALAIEDSDEVRRFEAEPEPIISVNGRDVKPEGSEAA